MVKSNIFGLKLVTIFIKNLRQNQPNMQLYYIYFLNKRSLHYNVYQNKQNNYLTFPFRRKSWYELGDSSSGNSALQVNESGNSAVMVSL